MRTSLKGAAYGLAKTFARPVGLYPFPKTHRRHLVDILDELRINCLLDVGGHYGEFGKLLRELGFDGHILSFEPVSESFKLLQDSAKGDAKWRTFPFALASEDGQSIIHLYKASDFNSLLSPSGVQDRFEHCTEEVGTETINLRRLDSVFDEVTKDIPGARIFLKMDTQGFDVQVVTGAAGVLDKILAMQSELPGICLYAHQPSLLEALSFYWEQGFRPTGFFPVNHANDGVTVLEWDAVLVREGAAAAAKQ